MLSLIMLSVSSVLTEVSDIPTEGYMQSLLGSPLKSRLFDSREVFESRIAADGYKHSSSDKLSLKVLRSVSRLTELFDLLAPNEGYKQVSLGFSLELLDLLVLTEVSDFLIPAEGFKQLFLELLVLTEVSDNLTPADGYKHLFLESLVLTEVSDFLTPADGYKHLFLIASFL